MNLTVILHNIRSTYNVGAILRTAEGFGVSRVVFSGYTPRYNDVNLLPHLREKLNGRIAKSALGAEELVALEAVDNLEAWLDNFRGVKLGLENNLALEEQERLLELGSKDLLQILDHEDEVALILGEEVNGISGAIRSKMDYFVEIPMRGKKESFNVSVATGIALWALSMPAQVVE